MRFWLVEARKAKNLTQQNVAKNIGVTRQMISAIENCTASPSVLVAKAIGKLLDIEWTRFFEGEERNE